jgi:5-aminopentanamidase
LKVAAYQAPLAATRSPDIVPLIAEQIGRCEALGVEVLCCPEGVLGGLADYAEQPTRIALTSEGPELRAVLAPLASATVTTIVGFTEIDREGRLYNAALVLRQGAVAGRYRKLHPAIRRSVYQAGLGTPVFTVGALTFGILICRDSTFTEPARSMASRGAAALFVPTNNGLPPERGGLDLVGESRRCDIARATENGVSVIRADVAGRTTDLVSHGSSAIVDRHGAVLAAARPLARDLIIADIPTARREGHGVTGRRPTSRFG